MAIAVVGAGIAGLSCALSLATAGAAVTVFDKGRSVGGRVATRRVGDLHFNHGAQYATARGESFDAMMRSMAKAGAATFWPAAGPGRWVGLPAMSGLPRFLAEALTKLPGTEIRLQRHASFLRRTPSGWTLRSLPSTDAKPGSASDSGGIVETFDTLLLALPPAQAIALLQTAGHGFIDSVSQVTIAPCWTVMAAFPAPCTPSCTAPDVQRFDNGPLVWIARDSARPGTPSGGPECWVAHASPGWSREHLEETAETVGPKLLALLGAAVGSRETPLYLAAHRWRYALTGKAAGNGVLMGRRKAAWPLRRLVSGWTRRGGLGVWPRAGRSDIKRLLGIVDRTR